MTTKITKNPILESFRKKQKELNKQITTHGKAALAAEFKRFFDEFPEVAMVRWSQYTPYFNDGDECVFNVYDFEMRQDFVANLNEECEYEDDNWLSGYELKGKPRLEKAHDFLEHNFRGIDDILRTTFGDHVQVLASKDGFDVTSYDHD